MTHQQAAKTNQAEAQTEVRAPLASVPLSTVRIHPLRRLQRLAGNQAVQRLVQAKLEIGSPDDRYEREADQVAKQVVSPFSTKLPQSLQHQSEQNARLRMSPGIQRRAGGGLNVTPTIESAIQHERGSGRPLPEMTRTQMEQAFGADFGDVRIHAILKRINSAVRSMREPSRQGRMFS